MPGHDGFRSEAFCAVVSCYVLGGFLSVSGEYVLHWTVLLSVSSPPESCLLNGFCFGAFRLSYGDRWLKVCNHGHEAAWVLCCVVFCSCGACSVSPSSCVRCIVIVILQNLKFSLFIKNQSFEHQQFSPEVGGQPSYLLTASYCTAQHTTNQASASAPRSPSELSPLAQYQWGQG